jgi:hypothetical protein
MPKHSYNPHLPESKKKGLTKAMVKKLEKHAKTASKAHIDEMIKHIRNGKSFSEAHKMAMKAKK